MKKFNLLFISVLFISTISCSIDEGNNPSKLKIINESSSNNNEATFTPITIKGSIIETNSNSISSRGICWSKTPNPTINNNILTLESNIINNEISNLSVNTMYYFRIFAIVNNKIIYGENISSSTLSLENSKWRFATYYPEGAFSSGTTIESTVNFYADRTTKFDEIGIGQGVFITYGSWSLNDNFLTYIWEGNNPNTSTYVYTGTINGMTIQGTFTHPSTPGTWTATLTD